MSTEAGASASTVTGSKLEILTGLTDRRLRQLAKAGYFPPPVNGKFQQNATIRGLFKYYREDYNQAAKTLNDAKLKKLRADAEMAQLKLAEAKRELIGRGVMSVFIRAWIAKLDLLLTAELENNLPPMLLGQPIDVMRSEMRQCHDRLRDATQRGLVRYEDQHSEPEELEEEPEPFQ
tara:strand:- start:166 stop:696 length:531 start_codon:yes stop_codon:yes gene_type:complete